MKIHLRQGYGGQRMRKGEGEKEAVKTCQSAPKVLFQLKLHLM